MRHLCPSQSHSYEASKVGFVPTGDKIIYSNVQKRGDLLILKVSWYQICQYVSKQLEALFLYNIYDLIVLLTYIIR